MTALFTVIALLVGFTVASGSSRADAAQNVVAGQLEPGPGQFYSTTPVTVLDTRTSSPLVAGATDTYNVFGEGELPSNGIGAVYIAVSALSPTANGCLVDFPGGSSDPGICNTSFEAGANTTDTDIVAVGTNGSVSVANQSSGSLNVAIKVLGYFGDGSELVAGDTYASVPQTAVLDTREGLGAPEAQVPGGGSITLQLAGEDGVPADADGVALYVGAADGSETGFLSAYPAGTADPSLSILGYQPSETVRDFVFEQLSSTGAVTLTNEGSGPVDMVVDLAGYFVGPTSSEAGAELTTVQPQRILDTRTTSPLAPDASLTFTATGVGGIPSTGVSEVAESVAALSPASTGYLSVYPAGGADPDTPVVNFVGSDAQSNDLSLGVVTAVSSGGQETVTNHSSGTVNVVISTRGYLSEPTAPGEVQGVASTFADGQADVSWAPPSSDGGANIESYTVSVAGGASDTVTGGTTEALINASTGDSVSVQATNAVGTGTASTPVSVASASEPTTCTVTSPAGSTPTVSVLQPTVTGTDSATPAFSAVLESSAGTPVSGALYLDTTSGQPIGGSPTATGTVTDGDLFTYVVPSGVLSAGTSYEWHVVATSDCPAPAAASSATQTFSMTTPSTPPATGPDSATISLQNTGSSGSELQDYSGAIDSSNAVTSPSGDFTVGEDTSSLHWAAGVSASLSSIPAGSYINSANLVLNTQCSLSSCSTPATLEAEPALSPVSAANTGSALANIPTTTPSSATAAPTTDLDLTAIVQDWLTGAEPNDGLVLTVPNLSTATTGVIVSSADLSISYTPPQSPTVPTSVSAQAGDGTVLVSWAPPTNTGYATSSGDGISQYTITASTPSGTAVTSTTTAGASSPVALTGLTDGSTYDISITASNAVGSSPAATATTTPIAAPGGTAQYVTAVSQLMNDEDAIQEGTYSTAAAALASNSEGPDISSWLDSVAPADLKVYNQMAQADEQDTNDTTSLSDISVVPSDADSAVTVYATASETFTTIDTSDGTAQSIPGTSVSNIAYTFNTTGATPTITGYADEDAVAAPAVNDANESAYSPALDDSASAASPLVMTSSGQFVSSAATPESTTGPRRQDLLNWAINNLNSGYDGYKDDCTDFASRAMHDGGGFPQLLEGQPALQVTNIKMWFHDRGLFNSTSRTWTEAKALLAFEQHYKATVLKYTNEVGQGDLLFANWSGQNGTNGVSHVAIVRKVTKSNLYVIQHSPSQSMEPVYKSATSWAGLDPHMKIYAYVPQYVTKVN